MLHIEHDSQVHDITTEVRIQFSIKLLASELDERVEAVKTKIRINLLLSEVKEHIKSKYNKWQAGE